MTLTLSTLEKIDLRMYWEDEASDFTPWLAQNLALLGDAIGMDLELEGKEMNVGRFKADILCKDTTSDAWVLIENQLEHTNHKHLGQLMTYAAGLDAANIVWVAQRFTDEHRAALDWLNRITTDGFHFFGLEVELWRIGKSDVAPKFNVVCQPNDWAKGITRASVSGLTTTEQLQSEYWQGFNEHLLQGKSKLKLQIGHVTHRVSISIGKGGFKLEARINTKSNNIAVALVLRHQYAKDYFSQLLESKTLIEEEIDKSLIWQKLEGKKRSQIKLELNNTLLSQREDWPQQFAWLKDHLERFHQAFAPRVKLLKQIEPETPLTDLDTQE